MEIKYFWSFRQVYSWFAVWILCSRFFFWDNLFKYTCTKNSFKKKIPLRKIIILFSPLIILLFHYALIEFKSLENIDNIKTLRVSCILFSIVGSFFMIFSLIMRFNYFYNVEAKHIFKLDIFYSFLISILIITVFLTLGSKYLVMAYFFASICSLATYSSLYLRK